MCWVLRPPSRTFVLVPHPRAGGLADSEAVEFGAGCPSPGSEGQRPVGRLLQGKPRLGVGRKGPDAALSATGNLGAEGSVDPSGYGPAGGWSTSPNRCAAVAACTRLVTPSLRRTLETWTLAVLPLMNSASPISRLDRPAAT
jgi:hypothetical protein